MDQAAQRPSRALLPQHGAVDRPRSDFMGTRRFDLLVLKELVPNHPRDVIHFNELVEIYRGFEASMGALHRFILKRIEHFEARDARGAIA